MSRLRAVAGVATALLLMITGCAGGDPLSTQDVQTGLGALRAEVVARHMRVLADDAFEGRAAGTTGYQKAADYVARQFETLGLQPAGDAGSYFQSVPLRRSLINARRSRLVLHRDGRARTLVRDEHYVIAGDFERGTVDLKAPLVYVGYGVSAPELGYDDYQGIEVRGKALVMFQGAPASLPHNERAYYSSGSVKLRNAVERGAVGVIQIRTPRSRRTAPWPRVVRHAGMPSMRWEEDGEPHDIFPEIRLGALLSESGMRALFETEAHTPEEVEAAVAESRPFSFDHKKSVE